LIKVYDPYSIKPLGEILLKIQNDLIDSQEKYENDSEEEVHYTISRDNNNPKWKGFDLSNYYKTFLKQKRGRS
jgi:hypothetical protein